MTESITSEVYQSLLNQLIDKKASPDLIEGVRQAMERKLIEEKDNDNI